MKQMGFEFNSKKKPDKSNCSEARVFSVSELNKLIKGQLESQFSLIWIQGEISNFTAHSSGHYYFSLKDKKSQVSAVMFRGFNSRLKFKPETGLEVLIRGKVTLYEPRGNYQIFCEVMEPVGAGALQLAFEQLKDKLKKEGLFDDALKRTLPQFPKHLAIVTSPTGAAIRDMIHVLNRRFQGLQITLVPVVVQGDKAPAEIVRGIFQAQTVKDVDVIIVGRGGGSMEDLWGFNDEGVARAIADCKIPIISAVGHEVDFTIADFVADLRAPTPSAAAEVVVKNTEDLLQRIQNFEDQIYRRMIELLETTKTKIAFLEKRLVDPQRRIQDLMMRSDELSTRLARAIRNQLKGLQGQLKTQTSLLDSLSPLKVVERGFSIIKIKDKLLRQANDVNQGDKLNIRISNGEINAEVKSVRVLTKEELSEL